MTDAADTGESRTDLRTRLRRARRALDESAQRAASTAAVARLLGLPELAGPGRLASYVATDGELDPAPAATALRDRGWTLFLPVLEEDRGMRFAPWREHGEMAVNRYGIAEPAASEAELLDAHALDVVLVPCVAVDPAGNRLGFGAGYYDRALERRGPLLVAIAHEAAIVESITPDDWDVPVHVVVTDAAVRRTGAGC